MTNIFLGKRNCQMVMVETKNINFNWVNTF